jgi:hypothetical protein
MRTYGKILTCLAMLFLVYTVAEAENQGSISGRVTWKDGYGSVAGASIYFYDASQTLIDSIQANQYGLFHKMISGGVYLVSVEKGNLIKEYYPNKYMADDADLVTVVVGQDVYLSFALDSGGWISGTFGVAGDNVESGLITAIKIDQPYEGWYKSLTLTGPFPSAYAISGLIPGTYKILGRARGKCTEYYPGYKDIINATQIEVKQDEGVPHISFVLNQVGWGSIQGQVFNQASGQGIQGLTLYAYQWHDFWQDPNLMTAISSVDGSYELKVPSGDYFIFCVYTGPDNMSTALYYNNCYEPMSANIIRIYSGIVADNIDFPIDLSVVHNLSISGSVVSKYAENELEGVVVTAINAGNGQVAGSAYSGRDGGFLVNGLSPGHYLLMFSGTYIIPYFYPQSENWQNGEVIELTDHFGNIRTEAITQDYGNNGLTIAGNVTSSEGPLAGARIYAFHDGQTEPNAYARTDDFGAYSIVSGLVPGYYRITCDLFGYDYREYPDLIYLDLMTNPEALNIDFYLGNETEAVSNGQLPGGKVSLSGNYPNPFNSKTLIRLYSDRNSELSSRLSVYNMLGQQIGNKTIRIVPGDNVIEWDANEFGHAAPSGIYYYRIDGVDKTYRMILLK